MTMFVNVYVHNGLTGEQSAEAIDINLAQVEVIRPAVIKDVKYYRLDTPGLKAYVSYEDYLYQVLPVLYPKEHAE